MKEYRAKDSKGRDVLFRQTGSVIEKSSTRGVWNCPGNEIWWLTLTPSELRAIADCIEGK